jgi:PAS domain S-box-containing protein
MPNSTGPSPETLKALETVPNMYLVIAPDLYILTASDAYLEATQTKRDLISGKYIFDAFPDNPNTPDGNDGMQQIEASLQTVLRTKAPHQMQVLRYDIPDIGQPGRFIPRYWEPSHTPVLDEHGNILYIIQLANNVTEKILTARALIKSQADQIETIGQIQGLNAELLTANIELRDTQQNLSLLNSQLEDRVAKRTLELHTANEEQAATNEELTAANEELTKIQGLLEGANTELATHTSRLQMAIESTRLGTWDFNPSTGELYWSKECREVYGISPDLPASFELFSQLIYPDDRTWVLERIAASVDPGKKGRYDLSYRINRYDDHETRWIKVQGNVFFKEDQAIRFIGTVLDITDMKSAEEKSSKLAAIIASSEDAIVSKTLDSVVTSWNGSAERIFGYTAEEMIGESIYKLIPEDRLDEEPLIITRINSGQRFEHFETKRLTKAGRLIDVSVSVSPIKDSQGNIIGCSKIARDITERKQDESRKNDFIGMVSHELKTPLTSLTALI